MPSKKKNKNKPKEGWVVELEEAEREVKKANQATPQHHLRVARAARKLRIWNKSKNAAGKGLTIDPHGPLRAQLVECQKQADVELSIPSDVDTDQYKEMPETFNHNKSLGSHDIFSNLNDLQFATMNGDVRLLEDLVASGVALDYPVLDYCSSYDSDFPDAEPAPKGSTALVLCCAHLAMETWLTKRGHRPRRISDDEEIDEQTSMMVECAILLVKLGADFHRKFILDPPSEVCGPLQSSYRRARIGGKTAQQLAQMAQLPELVKVMEELQSEEKRIALVYCRCGSRLPWKECHAGNTVGESPFYFEYRGRLIWRYSPMLRCPCRHSKKTQTKKTHYKCCWKESCQPYYLNDSDGQTIQAFNVNLSVCVSGADLKVMGITDQISFTKVIAECRSNPQKQAQFLKLCQEQEMARDNTRAYIMKHLEEGQVFKWTSRHWWIPKAELLVMVKRWNIALTKYCDEAGMTGSHRASVIEKNCATLYAPCGNASCTKIETKVKEFSKCSKCKTIAYCSSKCQRKGWKVHKGNCHAA
jgi:hypothetical protein